MRRTEPNADFHGAKMRSLIRATAATALFVLTFQTATPAHAAPWPRGEVVVPARLFQTKSKLDRVVLESNPRLYFAKEFDPKAKDLILVIGMPGWGGRSENFIGSLYNGLVDPRLRRRLVLASIQDPKTRGPRFQGQGDAAHANVWALDDEAIPALRHFITRLAADLGQLRVYFFGFSSGSPAAPLAATRIGETAGAGAGFKMEGAISLGTGSPVSARGLKATGQRVLFLVAPKARKKEVKARRYDQAKRSNAEASQERLAKNGATTYLRHVETARRHVDWHWGLMSQCRYYKSGRYDTGRGYWPNYWMSNPETFGHMAAFIQGQAPPQTITPPPTRCPHPPNVDNPDDPDAKVNDPARQAPWAPGTVGPETGKGKPAPPPTEW